MINEIINEIIKSVEKTKRLLIGLSLLKEAQNKVQVNYINGLFYKVEVKRKDFFDKMGDII